MHVIVFSTKPYDESFLQIANRGRHDITYLEGRLNAKTAVLAKNSGCVCPFVNDIVDASVIADFAKSGVKLIALRSAGFNNVDLAAAKAAGIAVARVPAYSPEAISEHTVALILSLDRNIPRAYARVRDGNFSLDGLMGFNLHGRTIGIVGTGRIGTGVARIMTSFGCKVLACDPMPNETCRRLGVTYVSLQDLLAASDIVTLHCPLTPQTHHLIDAAAIAQMRPGVMLVNTSRGATVDTVAVIAALKSGAIGHLALDVYEEEGDLFFENLSDVLIQDDVFSRLLTFPNVLITGHQAFFTTEAMTAIAQTTIDNITAFEATGTPLHPVT